MIQKIKNYWLSILGILIAIFDFGLDAVNPILLHFGLDEKYISILKGVFMIYGIIKLRNTNTIKTEKMTPEQTAAIARVVEILAEVDLELIGTRPKDR